MYDNNPYYNAAEFGLEDLGSIQWGEPSWNFDLTNVWRDGDVYFVASDSGCSCPSPFENYEGRKDLGPELTLKEAAGTLFDQLTEYIANDWNSKDDKQYVWRQFQETMFDMYSLKE